MRVVHAKRTLLCRNVVAQGQVQLIKTVPHSGDRCDCIVRLPVGFREDKRLLIGISTPCLQNMICQLDDPLVVLPLQTNDGQRPMNNACGHVLKAGNGNELLHLGTLHGEGVAAALEMIVT